MRGVYPVHISIVRLVIDQTLQCVLDNPAYLFVLHVEFFTGLLRRIIIVVRVRVRLILVFIIHIFIRRRRIIDEPPSQPFQIMCMI
ncbi:hypothetical protein CALCODRAFT_352430 [Calocera cornea HHB12733]|uniref:Uncharacterized protein n=1 Tax=Calocera cornea HHB12733 TaxID=1353952 RepID=A0A165ET42_9BASI|nr:hypothetical protein CALCODRAFT_352430 [Calocera cornea HHB12733]